MVNGVTYQAVDILRYNRTTNSWSLYFDGSDLGLDPAQSQINAIGVITSAGSESIYLSFSAGFVLTGPGFVDDSDIVRFVPTSLGETTSGSFEWVLDGSDVGLDANGEDIVALGLASDGDLLVSVKDDGGFDAGGVTGDDEDIFRFTPDGSHSGQASSGSWSHYFDGSAFGLDATSEDVVGFWEGSDGTLYLSTIGNYDVGAFSGVRGDVLACQPILTNGAITGCDFGSAPYWSGSTGLYGANQIQGLTVELPDSATTPTVTSRVISYQYDALYRLTNADYAGGDSYAYTYDPAGNRKTQTLNGVTLPATATTAPTV